MEEENLKKMLSFLTLISTNEQYSEDTDVIKKTINEISNLQLGNNYINNNILELIEHNISYLDRKYDDLYDLVNLYDSVKSSYKKLIHDKYVEELRKANRKKKEGN